MSKWISVNGKVLLNMEYMRSIYMYEDGDDSCICYDTLKDLRYKIIDIKSVSHGYECMSDIVDLLNAEVDSGLVYLHTPRVDEEVDDIEIEEGIAPPLP